MWTFRRAVEKDAAGLGELARKIFYDTFARFNTADDMAMYCAEAFTPSAMSEALRDPRTEIIVAEENGRLIAYAQLHRDEAPPEVQGASPVELKRFYVLGEWHGRGLAREMMREITMRAIEQGSDVLWLGVWEHNPRAIGFYRKLGFEEIGEQAFLLGTDRQRDLIMAIPLDRSDITPAAQPDIIREK